ncbi:MAG: DNA-processing protein DprA [Gemmobacter sp.]
MSSSPTPFTPPTTEDDDLSWLRLIRSRRVGPATFRRLMAEHGSARAALAALPAIARAAGVADYAPCTEAEARAELAAGRAAGAFLLRADDSRYPARLHDLPDAPPVLWCMGEAALLGRPMVALVGARNASSVGLRMARRLAEGLGAAGAVVGSGLARGIDAAAHAAALGRGTVAVMAGGVDSIYPPENAELAAAIAAQGLRLSERPPGTEARARDFPARNRIVAGMALGVVVVEAAVRSGSLLTARDALDLGRAVMAVPGHPVDPRAGGCNQLIREGATLVRDAADVLEALAEVLPVAGVSPGQVPRIVRGETATAAPLPPPQGPGAGAAGALAEAILARLGVAPIPEDQLIRDLARPASEVAPEVVALELAGAIRRGAGGMLARG